MKIFKSTTVNYHKLMGYKSKDSLAFENISSIELYANKDIGPMSTTTRDIAFMRCPLISTHLQEIMDTSEYILLSEAQIKECSNDVKRLSFDYYGTSGFWYLILAVNKMTSINEFKRITELYMPDEKVVTQIIDKEILPFNEVGVNNIIE